MASLFTPITLGRLTIPNRIVIAPMCTYSAREGCATDWHMIHLGQLAESGAGLLILEATAVSPEGRITAGDLGLWDQATEDALARVFTAVRRYAAAPMAVQLAHAGRKASTHAPWKGGQRSLPSEGGWQPVAPSAVPYAASDAEPQALDLAGIGRVVEAFRAAAIRAARMGFEAVEIHAAHGYLLHEFLSPLSNQRTDAYGGSFVGRIRLLMEVFKAVREALPSQVALGVRLSATDWVPGGWDLDQSVELALKLKAWGCDFIDVSSGGLSPLQQLQPEPGFQVPFAQAIKAASGLPTIAVGLITEPEHAQAILDQGQADMIALARGMLFNPRWPWHAAAKLGGTVNAPPQYWRSEPQGVSGLFKA